MSDRIRPCLLATLLATAGPAARSDALTGADVVVLANGTSADSIALARSYAARRGIDEKRIVLVRTSRTTEITRPRYEAEILKPVRLALTQRGLRDRTRCLCLMWGLPLRIAESRDSPAAKARAAAYAAHRKLHYRLAIDYKLLSTVGRTFPEPRTRQLKPIGKLFLSPMPEPPKPLPKVAALRDDLQQLLALKQLEVAKLPNAAQRKLASRQLLALHLELRGLQGLIEHIRKHRPPDAPDVQALQKQLAEADSRLGQMRRARPTPDGLREVLGLIEQKGGVLMAILQAAKVDSQVRRASHVVKTEAAVDSELALLWWQGYPSRGPVRNALHWRNRAAAKTAPPVLMTARIDGPSAGDAQRMIKASSAVEKTGLQGVFYIDAGGPNRVAAAARKQYDARLSQLHQFVRTQTKLKVVLDSKPTLFAKNSCPHAALYVGWYSLRKYVPAFMWTPGAVGWHVASWEAVHLHDPASQEWCPRMIQNGVAATLGAVSEPLLTQFPAPEEFFPLLLTGRYTIAECYWRTIPAASWQVTLIADPLYNPFKANPQVKLDALPPGLAP